MFDFASARAGGLGANMMELCREIMTDYVWNGGKIRMSARGSKEFPNLGTQLEQICHVILKSHIGHVLIEGVDFQ